LAVLLAGCAPRPAVVSAPPPRSASPPPAAVTAGFDVVEVDTGASPVTVLAARGDLGRVRVKVVAGPRAREQWQTAAQVAQRLGALAVINGGYFDEQSRPLGLIVSDGRQVNPLRSADWGVLLVRGRRAEIVHTRQVRELEGVQQALQCGPRLVAEGRPLKLKPSAPEPRSAVGLDAAGRLVLAATTHGGLTLAQFAAILARPEAEGGLGLSAALNLDGGPSSQMCVPGRADLPGGWAMPSHLALLPEKSLAEHAP
jgi:uncharacterized protein YigE (DUF2233 family)